MPQQNRPFKIREVTIGAWNLHGLFHTINSFRYLKINDSCVRDVLHKYQIFCLIKTHHVATESDLLHIPAGKKTLVKKDLKHQEDLLPMSIIVYDQGLLKCQSLEQNL